jgi:hypothetical protein
MQTALTTFLESYITLSTLEECPKDCFQLLDIQLTGGFVDRMSASLPGNRALPASQYDLSTYWGRVRHAAGLTDPRYENKLPIEARKLVRLGERPTN